MKDYYEDLWARLPDEPAGDIGRGRRGALLRAELRGGERVLDLGCGAGWACALALEAGAAEVVGADVAEAALARARRGHPGLEFVLIEIDAPLPFEDNRFDVVWASEVLEHVSDTGRWLSEARRVLVPRGRLLLTTPDHGRLRLALGGVERYSPPLGDHLHLYSARSLREVLDEFGFDPVDVRAVGGPPLLREQLLARAVR